MQIAKLTFYLPSSLNYFILIDLKNTLNPKGPKLSLEKENFCGSFPNLNLLLQSRNFATIVT